MMTAPAHGRSPRRPAWPTWPAARARQACVVYVEDNAVNALLFEGVMSLHGAWSLRIAPDGASALALLEDLTPDLLIIDAHLPDMNGLALIARIRALRAPLVRVPAVMFSADGMDAQIAASHAAGFVDHWVKPMATGALIAAMERLLAV